MDRKTATRRLAQTAGAGFVKTSTGFAGGGAKVEDVRLMQRTVGTQMGAKAAGSVRSCADALAMIEAGADHIGARAGAQIVEQVPSN